MPGWIPYNPDIEAWKNHFAKRGKGVKKLHFLANSKQPAKDEESVNLVTPTAQVVEQAKSTLKRKRDDELIPNQEED